MGDTLAYSTTDTPPAGLKLATDGTISGTPTDTTTATGVTLTVTISDGKGGSDTAQITIVVKESQALIVNSTGDTINDYDGQITLREALIRAENKAGADTISFDPTAFATVKTISLNTALPDLTTNITVNGPSAGVIVQGQNGFGLISVQSNAVITLSDLTLVRTKFYGISNAGQLFLNRVTVSGVGVGVVNANGATATIAASAFASSGSGISNTGMLGVSLSRFNGNTNGVLNNTGGDATINTSTLSNNSNGVANAGTLTLSNSTLASNGAGVKSSGGGVTMNQSTLVSNTNALLINAGTLAVTSSTVAGNGGGIKTAGTATVRGTLSASNGTNFSGTLSGSSAYNIFNLTAKSAGLETDANSFPVLKDNGGPTQTVALVIGSVATNANDPAIASGTEQRGTGFARVRRARADIGAFESDFTAESLTVTTTADEDNDTSDARAGSGTSLREAINYANTKEGTDIISFDPAVFGTQQTITLNTSLPAITQNLTINAPTVGVMVAAGKAGKIFTITGSEVTVVLSRLSLNGASTGVQNEGIFTLSNGDLSNNGTGLANASGATATLQNTLLRSNGTGVSNSGTLNANLSTFSGGTSGIVNNLGASATLDGSSLLKISNGVVNAGTLVLSNSTLAGNGSGVKSSGGSVTVNQCTLVSNSNALLINAGTLSVANSTITGNGGGIKTAGTATVQGTLSVSNGTNFSGVLSAQSASNILNMTAKVAGLETDNNGFPVLKDNGGPTLTVALLAGSRALNAGDPALTSGTDQRGTGFPRVVGGRADIGAFEKQSTEARGLVAPSGSSGGSS